MKGALIRMKKICVFGSLNVDMTLFVPRFNLPGETLTGTGMSIFTGGKGGNQAVACARLGADVMMIGCLGDDANYALMKAMLSVGHRIPQHSILLSTGGAKEKAAMLDAARMLRDHGYEIYATGGTSRYLSEQGIENTLVHWPSEADKQPQALDLLHERKIDLVVNIPKDLTAGELTNGYKIRRAAVDLNIPLLTNSRLAAAFIQAFCTIKPEDLAIKSWEEYK
jgi:carbamoyl-phosphate synthase large subunit